MILAKHRYLLLIFVYTIFLGEVSGQKGHMPLSEVISKNATSRQDTAIEARKRNALTIEQPDTNFTWEKYAAFLTKISDTNKYIVLPLNEFRKTFNSRKIVIGLRHDVDNDLNIAYEFSETELKLGFRSTYFILHTAPYYLANQSSMALHSQNIIPILKAMQNDRKFEIGWHNDLVTLQLIYKLNPVLFLHDELAWLRDNGINIFGTAAHGSNYCKVYHYMNFYFFHDCTYPVVPDRENNITVPVNGVNIPIMKGNLSDFDLEYEAYFLNNNKAFSDATITNGIRWDIGMLDLKQLQEGDRVIILIHPIHWHKASVNARIESFYISGQNSSSIDPVNSAISVEMPYGTNPVSLPATFILSPGAYAKVSGKLQVSGSSKNNFSNPLTYEVFAENRDIHASWKVNVRVAKNSACTFNSFLIPGLTRSVNIDNIQKTIFVKVNEGTDLTHLPVQFELSPGATAWIDSDQQFSNGNFHNFSKSIKYRILAEDGISSSYWIVTVRVVQNCANFISFSVPGLMMPATIDTVNNIVYLKMFPDVPAGELNVSFEVSAGARVWVGKLELVGNNYIVDFAEPVEFDIVSKDNTVIKRWTVTLLKETDNVSDGSLLDVVVFPNPSGGLIKMKFRDIMTSPTIVEIFNTRGVKVYNDLFLETGDFTLEADLSGFPSGIYILRYSKNEQPLRFVIL
jgi:hypothetical protein